MADPTDEDDTSADALEPERGVANRLGGVSPRASAVGPFASRFFLERRRWLEAEAQRELAEHRIRSLLQIARPPAPVAQIAVVGRAFGELAESGRRHVLPLLLPGADAVLSFLEDLYTAITGLRVDYSEFEDVEASDTERAFAIIGSVLAIVPEVGPLLRQGGRVARIASRMVRPTAEVESALRVLNRVSARRLSVRSALERARRGEPLTFEQAQGLSGYVDTLKTLQVRRRPVLGTAESGAALREADVVPDRAITGRARNRTTTTQREPGTGARTRSRQGRGRDRRQPREGRPQAAADGRLARSQFDCRLRRTHGWHACSATMPRGFAAPRKSSPAHVPR